MRLCPRCNATYADDATFCPEDGARLGDSASDGEEDRFVGLKLGDRYLLEERIGAGGLGQVYRARHLRMDRAFAVKLLLPTMAAREDIVKRFDREAKALSRLTHPCCVGVTDYGFSQDHGPYIVMELVDGAPLSHYTRGEGLPLQVGVEVVCMVLRGLEHAHGHGIVHRDLKPDNIMLVERPLEPGRLLPKILDFGLAKIRAGFGRSGEGDLTQDGQIVGTPTYLPPERVLRPAAVDDSLADIYSTGIILYELCCGRRPFEDDDVVALVDMHLSQPPPPPRGLRPSLPEPLEEAILRALEKKPEDRFPGAADFRGVLERILPLPPGVADEKPGGRQRSTSVLTKVERPSSDHGGIGTDPTRLAPSSQTWSARGAASPWRRRLILGGAGALVLAVLGVGLGLLASRNDRGSDQPIEPKRKVATASATAEKTEAAPTEEPEATANRATTPKTAPETPDGRAWTPPPALRRAARLWKYPHHRQRANRQLRRYLTRHRSDAAAHLHVARLYLYALWADDGVKMVGKALKIDPDLRLDTRTLVALTFAYRRSSSHWRARRLIRAHAGDRAPVVLLASAAAMHDVRVRRNLISDARRAGAERDPLARRLLALARARTCKNRRKALEELAGQDDPALRITLALLVENDRCLSRRARRMIKAF
jgi:serine/threonine-protein kinase